MQIHVGRTRFLHRGHAISKHDMAESNGHGRNRCMSYHPILSTPCPTNTNTNFLPEVPAKRAAEHVPRFYAMAQESALWTAHGLLCTSPPPSRKHCLDILKKRPEILDLLFDCAIIARPAWYPETQVDSIACEVIALLFQWPSHIVPGVSTPQDNVFRAQEWKAMTQIAAILTSRDEWCEKIIEVWMKIEEEDWREVRGWVMSLCLFVARLTTPKKLV